MDGETQRRPIPPRRPLGSGDRWVDGPHGRFWGAFGAAGLLVGHPGRGVLLQLRASWSHQGGTWGVPGGAREEGESAEHAAMREAAEETGLPSRLVRVLGSEVYDIGYWSYTTVIARIEEYYEPFIGDAESAAIEWVPLDKVENLPLHPGFGSSWPLLRRRLGELDPVFA